MLCYTLYEPVIKDSVMSQTRVLTTHPSSYTATPAHSPLLPTSITNRKPDLIFLAHLELRRALFDLSRCQVHSRQMFILARLKITLFNNSFSLDKFSDNTANTSPQTTLLTHVRSLHVFTFTAIHGDWRCFCSLIGPVSLLLPAV